MARNKYPEETVNRILDAASSLFLEKGYEKTTIQDIIDELGDLSKGAIYHHFKSKEDIFDAFAKRVAGVIEIKKISEEHANMSGLEMLKSIVDSSLFSTHQELILPVMPNLLKHPKLLAIHIKSLVDGEVTENILPIIQSGVKDGSINTDYPEQASELLLVLFNLYLNPSIFEADTQMIKKRALFVKDLLEKIGIPILEERHIKRIEEISYAFKKVI